MRASLDRRGYRNAHVTIDTSDWYYDERLRHRLERDPEFPVARFREPYVEHVLDRARFYDRLGQDVLGGSVPHTLLVHDNLLNAMFLGDVLGALEAEGWETIDADAAYEDAVFRERVDALPAGESLIWSLAHATGRFEDRRGRRVRGSATGRARALTASASVGGFGGGPVAQLGEGSRDP